MTISRRSFFTAVAGAIAGAVASKALAVEPAPPVDRKALTFAEFCRQYLPEQKIAPWQEDILPKIQAARLTAKVKIPACLLEDSMIDFRDRYAAEFARNCADRFDRECWATFTVPESHTKLDIGSLKAVMDSLPKYNRGLIAISGFRAFEGHSPIPVTTLPPGWEMRQYGPYKAADGQPAVDPKEWHLLVRGRFDFSLDDQKTPR
jgi:hypothetical protein